MTTIITSATIITSTSTPTPTLTLPTPTPTPNPLPLLLLLALVSCSTTTNPTLPLSLSDFFPFWWQTRLAWPYGIVCGVRWQPRLLQRASEAAANWGRSHSRGPARYPTEHVQRKIQRRYGPDAKRRAGDGSLQSNRRRSPPATRRALGGKGAPGWWSVSEQGTEELLHSSLQRPPTSAAKTTNDNPLQKIACDSSKESTRASKTEMLMCPACVDPEQQICATQFGRWQGMEAVPARTPHAALLHSATGRAAAFQRGDWRHLLQHTDAKSRPARSSPAECLAAEIEGLLGATSASSSVPCFGSVSNAPRHPRAPLQPMRAAGGVCCRLCSMNRRLRLRQHPMGV